MSAVTNIWRQLVQRRLWPVAILLIAAVVAVPLKLAKSPAPAPQVPVAKADATNELTTQPIVAPAAATDRAKRRHVLGAAKNPFVVIKAPATIVATDKPSASVVKPTPSGTGSSQSGSSQGSGGGSPTGGSPPVASPPAVPKPAPKRYALYDLTVRFGDATADSLQRSTLKRLQPLPSADDPVLIYLGVMKDGKTAVFLVDHGVVATGDGSCEPAPDTCETIHLRAGETEFLDVTDALGTVTGQFELDLVNVHKGATASAKQAKASYAGTKSGRRLLKARTSGSGLARYGFDAATGTLRRLSRRPRAAVVARVGLAQAGLGRR